MKKRLPNDGTIEEGDIFWLSDPYTCEGAVSHANYWLVLLAIFKEGRHVGGMVPGSLPTNAISIF